MIVLD